MDKEAVDVQEQHTLYKQVHPPTGVRLCCQAFLTHAAGKDGRRVLPNLVVARGTLLQVFYARTSPADEAACWLELAAELELAGVAESLVPLQSRAPGVGRDAVLLTFRDAKLVALDWDELSGGLATASLHSWEGDAALRGGREVFPRGPRALADPQGRCAAVLLYAHHLALLPSTGADGLEAVAPGGGGARARQLGASYTLSLARLGVREARDACFLHRYNEPVLLVLHEAAPTWAGLATERRDTMCLTAFSLNLAHQKHLRLWHAAGLPADAAALLPVPLGGALVLCNTLLLYHSQGVSCALAVHPKAAPGVVPPFMDLNPMREPPSATAARHARKFATNLEPDAAAGAAAGAPRAEGVALELRDAVGAWLTPSTLLLAAASGQLALLSLEVAAGSVRRLRLKLVREGPPPACACRLGQSWVFLGSWSADSVLLHASPQGQERPLRLEGGAKVLALPAPKAAAPEVKPDPDGSSGAADAAGDEAGGGAAAGAEPTPDRAEQGPASKRQRTQEAGEEAEGDEEFESLFRSIETARISTIATGATDFAFKLVDSLLGLGPICSAAFAPAAAGQQGQQLLAVAGAGQSGSLLALRRGILPELITEVPLAGVRGLWAVRFRPEGLPWEPDFAWHSFLLLSVGRTTKVLQTGEELSELQAAQVDFALQKPTLLAANLLSWARTVQVCPDRVILLAGSSRQAETSVQELLAADAAPTGIQGDRAAQAAGNAAGVRILAAAAADPYLLLHLSNGSAALLRGSLETGRLHAVPEARPALQEVPASDPSAHITSCTLYKDRSGWLARCAGVQSSVFCVTCDASSLLQVFALPSMELVFDHAPATEGAACLAGEPEPEPGPEAPPADGDAEFLGSRPVAVELRMDSFRSSAEAMPDPEADSGGAEAGMPCERPVLIMLLSDGGMLAYQAFAAPVGLRLARLRLDWVGHADGRGARGLSARMTRFDGLGEGKLVYSGIFIAGSRPLWLVSTRGGLVPHPMEVPGPVAAMTPFNNVNCPQGFITAGGAGGAAALAIGQLPAGVRLDTRWPTCRTLLRATPHALAFLPAFNIYALLVSRAAPAQKRLPEEEGGDTHATYAYAAAEAAAAEAGREELGQLRLVRPGSWQTAWRWDLVPGETPLCARQLSLTDASTGRPVTLLAVGTSHACGEDYPCTGRLLFFLPAKGEPDPATQLERWTAELLYVREFQGPVTALVGVEGALVVAWGGRLEAQRWDGRRLETTAFHEAPVLVTGLAAIKRFLLAADAHKGAAFLQLAPDGRAFHALAKDFDNCDARGAEFLVCGPKLFALVADAAANLRLLTYQPDHPAAWAGRRLLPVGALHAGQEVGCILPARLQPAGVKAPPRGALLAGLDGGLAALAPLWLEGMAPPLRALRRLLELKAPAPAGLNARSFRERWKHTPKAMGGGERWGGQPALRTMLDGDLLWQYQWLPHAQQTALAYSIGFDKDQLLALLDSLAAAMAVL